MSKILTPAQQRRKEYRAKWYLENKERIHRLQRIWKTNNKEAIQETRKVFYRKHKKRLKAASTEWQKKNKVLSKSYREKWRLAKYGPKNPTLCYVCGAQLSRGNTYNVCSRTSECRKVRQDRIKAARLNERCA